MKQCISYWSVEGGLICEGCERPLDKDAVYEAVSIEHAEAMDNYDPSEADLITYNGPQ